MVEKNKRRATVSLELDLDSSNPHIAKLASYLKYGYPVGKGGLGKIKGREFVLYCLGNYLFPDEDLAEPEEPKESKQGPEPEKEEKIEENAIDVAQTQLDKLLHNTEDLKEDEEEQEGGGTLESLLDKDDW
jgi:hypothetical protein